MELSIDINANGLKTLNVKRSGARSFSIQTNGNLPITHKMVNSDLDSFGWRVCAKRELMEHIALYGTPHQKHIVGLT